MSFYQPTTGETIHTGLWNEKQDDIERDQILVDIAQNITDAAMARYLAALEKLWYPDVYPEIYFIAAASSVTYPLQIPGIARLKRALMFDIDGTYPSLVNLYIEAFGHLPLTLTANRADLSGFAFRIFGGSTIKIENVDATHPCRVYLEWEMWKGDDG